MRSVGVSMIELGLVPWGFVRNLVFFWGTWCVQLGGGPSGIVFGLRKRGFLACSRRLDVDSSFGASDLIVSL
jgi:hypothetical protein